MAYVIAFFVLLILIIVERRISYDRRERNLRKGIDVQHVNENSFQNYAKFYGQIFPNDENFDTKLSTIYRLIVNEGRTNIQEIAELSLCTLPECVLKIRYLKNKRLIGDYYIDTTNMLLLPCSLEDQKLLDKYKPFIYNSHLQVNDIANVINNPKYLSIDELRNEIFLELKHLDDLGLINGVKIDDIDHRIIYYTIEKRKVYEDHETVHCPNCGALNDVDVDEKIRCSYCDTIIKGKNLVDKEL